MDGNWDAAVESTVAEDTALMDGRFGLKPARAGWGSAISAWFQSGIPADAVNYYLPIEVVGGCH